MNPPCMFTHSFTYYTYSSLDKALKSVSRFELHFSPQNLVYKLSLYTSDKRGVL